MNLKKWKNVDLRLWWVVLAGLIVFILYYFIFSPPIHFPLKKTIRIEKGMTVEKIADYLKETKIIRSKIAFASILSLSDKDENIVAGQYKFERPFSLFTVVKRLISGTFGFHMVKVAIPEGATNAETALIFDQKLPVFNKDNFLKMAADKEGYLFPDTYFFTPVATEEDVFKKLTDNFILKAGSYQMESLVTGHSFQEIIIMASLLEEEARKTEDRKMISGILWRRINENMPLQVDAVFPYIVGRNTYQVTKDDLNNPSPFNTYRYKGLPPAPISNPGLDSITAALRPTQSDFLFYLSDRAGIMHYARDFEEHKINREKYL